HEPTTAQRARGVHGEHLGHRVDLAAEQRLQEGRATVGVGRLVREELPRLALPDEGARRAEQLVLDLLERPARLGGREDRVQAQALGRVGEVGLARPARADQAGHEVHDPLVEARGQDGGHEGRLVRAGPRRVRERAPQRRRPVERRGDREELLAQGERALSRRAQDRLEPVPRLRQGLAARSAHQRSSEAVPAALAAAGPAASSSSRKRSTTRVWRAESASDSPTIFDASSVASRPTSLRSETAACWRSASIWRCAVSTMRAASSDAFARRSATMAEPSARASSRIFAASARASCSCWWYSASAAAASACADSALARPPSIFAVRSSRIAWNFGRTAL